MNVPGLSPSTLADIQTRYKAHQAYQSPNVATTPDGSVTLTVGSDGGGCMDPTLHWIRAARGHNKIYEHSNKGGDSYSTPAMNPDGRTGYVVASHCGRKGYTYKIMTVKVDGGLVKRPSTLAKCPPYPRALAVSADGETLAYGVDKEVRVVPARPGLLGRIFGVRQETVATLPQAVEDLEYLGDGSVLAYPTRFEQQCWVVRPGQAAVRVPLAALSPEKYRDNLKQQLPWLDPRQLDAFVAQAPWLVDDTAGVKRHEAVASPARPELRAILVGAENGQPALYTWDGKQASELATLPTQALGWGNNLFWSQDGALVMVPNSKESTISLVDAANGQITTMPSSMGFSNVVEAPDRSRVVSLGTAGSGGAALWSWDRKSDPVQLVGLAGKPPQGAVSMAWCGDNLVTWYRPKGEERYSTHVVDMQGTYYPIPAADKVEVEGDTVKLTLGDEVHAVKVPDDLDGLIEQAWYQKTCDKALFGGATGPKGDLRIERGADHLEIGGVTVPVKSAPPKTNR
jgi:hypothetical protein